MMGLEPARLLTITLELGYEHPTITNWPIDCFGGPGGTGTRGAGLNTLLPPRPPVEWDPAADNLVVEASSAGGMLPDFNYVPAARLWGDGRLVWTSYNSNGGRSVQTRTLTPDEMRALIVRIEDEGFFGWNDQYSPSVVYDAPITCLRVSLTTTSKSVCEMISGAPAGFAGFSQSWAAARERPAPISCRNAVT